MKPLLRPFLLLAAAALLAAPHALADSGSKSPVGFPQVGREAVSMPTVVTYSLTDKPLTRSLTVTNAKGDTLGAIRYAYSYDGFDRLVKTEATAAGETKTLAEDSYDPFGRLASSRLGPATPGNPGNEIIYSYATRGALKSILAPRFSQRLLYAEGATPCYNGNISANLWQGLNGINRRYDYLYDPAGRLLKAEYTESGRDPEMYKLFRSIPDYSAYYTYDRNSNPETILRYGVQDKSSDDECVYLHFGMIDDLIFHRDGNRLNAIVDDSGSAYYAGATDFVDDQTDDDEYEYDANGNVIFDLNRGIDYIAYNELNLPAVIVSKNAVIKNFYDTGGRLIRRVTQQTGHDGFSSREPVTTMDVETYVNGFTFKTGSGDWQLKQIDTPTGFINPAGEVYSFVKDYQGNVRQVLNERGGMVQESDYYPYGMLFGESDVNGSRSDINRRRFSGKEYISAAGLNLYDFSARYLSPDGPGFLGSDPMQADYASLSPTAYCAADPINFIDPSGMKFVFHFSDDDQGLYDSLMSYVREMPEFQLLYNILDEAEDIFDVYFEDKIVEKSAEGIDQEVPMSFTTSASGGTLRFSRSAFPTAYNILEDHFHVFQNMNKDLYSYPFNIEQEAKTFANIVLAVNPMGATTANLTANSIKCLTTTDFVYAPNAKQLINGPFSKAYISDNPAFVNSYNQNNNGNAAYRIRSDNKPMGLIKFYNLFFRR